MRASCAKVAGGGKHDPIEHLPRLTLLSGRPDHDLVGHARCTDVKIGAHARHLCHERLQPISCGREELQRVRRHIDTRRRVGHIHQRRGPGYGDGLLNGPQGHRLVQCRYKSYRQPYILALDRLKARELVGDCIDANWQRTQAILASLVSNDADLRDLQRRTGRHNCYARQDCT